MRLPGTIVIASRNAGKVAELRHLLSTWGVEVRGIAEFPGAPEPVESGASYAENAHIKAVSAATHTGLPALGDDSGIEVDALDGRPGLHSARYGGPGLGDGDRVARLLVELEGVPRERRTARYRAVVLLAWPDGRTVEASGACDGHIAFDARGTGGFGYDPVFVHAQTGLTFGETRPEDKLQQDHRGRAMRALLDRINAACGTAVR